MARDWMLAGMCPCADPYEPSLLKTENSVLYFYFSVLDFTGWVVTWFLLGYTVRKNGGLLFTPMF